MKPQDRPPEIRDLRVISGDATRAKAEHREESLKQFQSLPVSARLEKALSMVVPSQRGNQRR